MRIRSAGVASAVDANMAVAASQPKAKTRNPVIIHDVCAVSSCLMVNERAMLLPGVRRGSVMIAERNKEWRTVEQAVCQTCHAQSFEPLGVDLSRLF